MDYTHYRVCPYFGGVRREFSWCFLSTVSLTLIDSAISYFAPACRHLMSREDYLIGQPSKIQHSHVAVRQPCFILQMPCLTATSVIAYNLVLLGLFSPLIYLDLSGQAAGLSPNFTFYLISIANCSSLIGRLSSGILADRYGAMNTLIPTTLIGGLMSFAWPYVTSQVAPLVVVTIIYGCMTGTFISLIPSTPARLGGMSDAGRRYVQSIMIMWLHVKLRYYFL